MDSYLDSLLSFLQVYRYFALAIVMYLGAFGLPIPVNIIILAVGAFAARGFFSFWASLAIAAVFTTLADLSAYGLTRRYGDVILRFLHLRNMRFFANLEKEIRSDAMITVFITRFGSGVSPLTNVLAGVAGVPFRKFFLSDAAGNIIEPLAFLAIGYGLGIYWRDFSGLPDLIGVIVAFISIAFVLIRIQMRFSRKYRTGDE